MSSNIEQHNETTFIISVISELVLGVSYFDKSASMFLIKGYIIISSIILVFFGVTMIREH